MPDDSLITTTDTNPNSRVGAHDQAPPPQQGSTSEVKASACVFYRHSLTCHQYYLQLRKDLLEERIHCDDEASLLLASLALQAEYGDYQPEVGSLFLSQVKCALVDSFVCFLSVVCLAWLCCWQSKPAHAKQAFPTTLRLQPLSCSWGNPG